jgi:glycosyltransferase involved in cell wall biosynthesis
MNLYFYLKHFPPRGDDLNEGSRKFVHGLASGLAACGAEVSVLCEGPEESTVHTPAGYDIQCFVNRENSPSFFLASGLKQYFRNRRENCLVVLTGIFHPSVYAMSRLLKKHGVPYVVSPLDPYHPSIFQKNAHLKWPYWYLLEQHMLRQATAIQVLDIRHTEWLRRLGIETQVIATPCGFFPKDVHPESSLHWQEDGDVKLFFLGRLDAHNKGLDLLLDAFGQLVKVTNAQLVVQGPDWGDRKSLEQRAAKLSLLRKVSFLEPEYDKSPSSLIANSDIFCLPSRFEGFGQSGLEAMLAGRVLLISEVAGIAPHVQASGCGVVVAPEVSAIKVGLMELLQRRSEWKDMGLRGRCYALEHLDWIKIASAALEQYERLVP